MIVTIEATLLMKGYASSDKEMVFFWIAPCLIFVGALVLSFTVKGWSRWIWIGLTILVAIILLIMMYTFLFLNIQY
ncbi:MAG TPA: hypothetical protein PKD19_02365 [Candidatus Saccharibacteria bacterium]|nr:hypothetical protein [Candidatus Saccharibacteria bacterium]